MRDTSHYPIPKIGKCPGLKRKDLAGELAILERYVQQGALTPGGWVKDDPVKRLAKIRKKLHPHEG